MSKRNTGDEPKVEIKLNRKMRMWNKYRSYCIGGGAVIVLLIILALIFKGCSNGKNNRDDATQPSSMAVLETTAPPETQSTAEQTTTQAQETQPETTQAESSGNSYMIEGSAETQDFTSESAFSDSVFLGDSIADGISYYGYLSDAQVVSDGNMTARNAGDYVDTVMASNPKNVIIMLGLNDANYGTMSAETIVSNIGSIVSAIHGKNSETKVYVISVLPVTSDFEGKSNVRQSLIDEINSGLSENAQTMNATYIDAASAYKDGSGYLKSECTGNGSNLYNEYYPFLLNGIAKALGN